tara:strand:- start:374 stop:601 length:228 start_codon:yes stop_codon:yes gene_type:complete
MELDVSTIWSAVITLVLAPLAWVFTYLVREVKAQQMLLRETREDYARKDDVRNDVNKLMDALHRLEDKLDKVLSK